MKMAGSLIKLSAISFISLFGFDEPLLPAHVPVTVQLGSDTFVTTEECTEVALILEAKLICNLFQTLFIVV